MSQEMLQGKHWGCPHTEATARAFQISLLCVRTWSSSLMQLSLNMSGLAL